MSKTQLGNFFEDFTLGQEIVHATPRTVNEGDIALYTALYGTRYMVQSSEPHAMALGFEAMPLDDFLSFHVVFGKTVPDISLNAVANLGYAEVRFGAPVYAGDTLRTVSSVIGLKENSNGKTGVVYVNSVGINHREEVVLDYVRWVMVKKRDVTAPAPETMIPSLENQITVDALVVPEGLDFSDYDTDLAGSPYLWNDYDVGEKINHADGMTIEEAEHQMATRLYQNTAKVHFDQSAAQDSRFGKRLIYGGHVISLARALSFNGLGNGFKVAAVNAGSHVNPTFAGDTIFAWTEVLEKQSIQGRDDMGALRLRLVACKDHVPSDFPYKLADGSYHPAVVLDLDYWVLMPRRTVA